MQIGIGIISETHLLDEDAEALGFPVYTAARKMGRSRRKEGVLTLANNDISCRKLVGVPKSLPPIDACSCILYPTEEDTYQIRITGVYVPPSAEARSEMTEAPLERDYHIRGQGSGLASDFLAGDFNPNTWKGGGGKLSHEWLAESGLCELSNPALPTFETGSVLDKFLLLPGDGIPDKWLPDGGWEEHLAGGGNPEAEGPDYPAAPFPSPWIADHHPVMPGMAGAKEMAPRQSGQVHKYQIHNLTKEERTVKRTELQTYLADNRL